MFYYYIETTATESAQKLIVAAWLINVENTGELLPMNQGANSDPRFTDLIHFIKTQVEIISDPSLRDNGFFCFSWKWRHLQFMSLHFMQHR